MMLSVCCVHRA